MKAISSGDAQITLPLYSVECVVAQYLLDATMVHIPLTIRLCQNAREQNVSMNHPVGMAAFSMYMSIHQTCNMVMVLSREIAKHIPQYKEALPLLWSDANPEMRGQPDPEGGPAFDKLEIQLSQWRLNFQKFIKKIDPTSPALFAKHTFDPDL